jgi:hypothetical protein
MTAVTIDVSVVDGSNTTITPNPAYPIQAPVNIAEVSGAVVNAPVNITELAFGYIIAPIDITELTAGVVAVPVDITGVSAGTVAIPFDITELTPVDIVVPVNISEVSAGNLSVPANITELAAGSVPVPIDITELAEGNVLAPVDITEETPVDINAPVNITEVSAGTVSVPANITELTPSTLSVPATITANALDPEVPPFSLKNARILYLNKLIGSAVTTDAGSNGSFVLIPNTADRYTVTNGGAITFTLAANQDFDTVCLGAHNLGSENHSVGVEYSTGVASAFIAFKAGQNPSDDTAIMFHNSSTVSARRIKVTVSGSGSVFVGSVYAGVALQMQRPFFAGHSPLPLSARTIKYSSVTEGGNFVGEQIRRLGFRTSAPFKNLSNDWYRTYFQPFVVHARTLPFFFAWNLDQYSTDVGYCKVNEDITPAYGSLDMFNVSFDMVGFG